MLTSTPKPWLPKRVPRLGIGFTDLGFNPSKTFYRGQGRGRTGDLSSFSRTLVPTELPGHAKAINIKDENRPCSDPDGTRTRDLRRDRAAR